MSDEIRDVVIHSLKSHYLLKRLTDTELCDLLDFMKERTFGDGETIITEGEPGDEFFVLISGEVTFYKIDEETGIEKKLGEKSEGYFGDLGTIYVISGLNYILV
jgi:cAMP-dependent protein kinase regulator